LHKFISPTFTWACLIIRDLAEGSVNLKFTGGFTGEIEENAIENFRHVSNMTYLNQIPPNWKSWMLLLFHMSCG